MLTTAPTQEMIAAWKQIYEAHRASLKPNRRPGAEVARYFESRYPHQLLDDAVFRQAVSLNITENGHSARKLPPGTLPDVRCYKTGNVFVGIDMCTGEFHVESENTEEMISVHDDLFVYRGLDAEDINNFFLAAEYVTLSEKQGLF